MQQNSHEQNPRPVQQMDIKQKPGHNTTTITAINITHAGYYTITIQHIAINRKLGHHKAIKQQNNNLTEIKTLLNNLQWG